MGLAILGFCAVLVEDYKKKNTNVTLLKDYVISIKNIASNQPHEGHQNYVLLFRYHFQLNIMPKTKQSDNLKFNTNGGSCEQLPRTHLSGRGSRLLGCLLGFLGLLGSSEREREKKHDFHYFASLNFLTTLSVQELLISHCMMLSTHVCLPHTMYKMDRQAYQKPEQYNFLNVFLRAM